MSSSSNTATLTFPESFPFLVSPLPFFIEVFLGLGLGVLDLELLPLRGLLPTLLTDRVSSDGTFFLEAPWTLPLELGLEFLEPFDDKELFLSCLLGQSFSQCPDLPHLIHWPLLLL